MTSQAAPTPAEFGVLQDVARAGQAMIYRVAESGSSQYLAEVERFQIIWNSAAPVLGSGQFMPRSYYQSLAEDGMYGPNTSTMLWYTIGTANPKPPRYASGMAAWMGVNHDLVAQMVGPSAVDPVEQIVTDQTYNPVNTDTQAGQMINQAEQSGSLITTNENINPPAPLPMCETLPSPWSVLCESLGSKKYEGRVARCEPIVPMDALEGDFYNCIEVGPNHYTGPGSVAADAGFEGPMTGQDSSSWTPWWLADDPSSYPMTAIEAQGCPTVDWMRNHPDKVFAYQGLFDRCVPGGGTLDIPVTTHTRDEINFATDTPILATRIAPDYKIIAGLVAAAALGGTLWYMRARKPRRRAA
jgi:hypothetical protein